MQRNLSEFAISRLRQKGLRTFTIEDLKRELAIDSNAAWGLAHRLERSGKSFRIRRGLYVVVPVEAWEQNAGLPGDWYSAAAAIVEPAPYALAYYTAMDVHRMIQHPLRTVFVAVTSQRRDLRVGQIQFKFVTLKPSRFFGHTDFEVGDAKTVGVTDLERTVIDSIDRMDLCGGIEEVFRGLMKIHEDIDSDRLVRYVQRLKQPTLAKRLGFLLDLAGHMDQELIRDLELAGGRLHRYTRMENAGPPEGKRDKRWELIINADVTRLIRGTST